MELNILTRLFYLVLAVILLGFVAVLGVAVCRLWVQDKIASRVVHDVRY